MRNFKFDKPDANKTKFKSIRIFVISFIVLVFVIIVASCINRDYDYSVISNEKVIGYTFTPYATEGCVVYYTKDGVMKGTTCGNFTIQKGYKAKVNQDY